jgi:Cu-processing system ATP-binding protein
VQKVSASIAFMFNPEIVVMDEPFAGLDLLAADVLKKKINKEKNNGKTILLTSHTFNEIDAIVSHVIFMNTGTALFYKPLQELLSTAGKDNVTDAVMHLLK